MSEMPCTHSPALWKPTSASSQFVQVTAATLSASFRLCILHTKAFSWCVAWNLRSVMSRRKAFAHCQKSHFKIWQSLSHDFFLTCFVAVVVGAASLFFPHHLRDQSACHFVIWNKWCNQGWVSSDQPHARKKTNSVWLRASSFVRFTDCYSCWSKFPPQRKTIVNLETVVSCLVDVCLGFDLGVTCQWTTLMLAWNPVDQSRDMSWSRLFAVMWSPVWPCGMTCHPVSE